jgi:tetratricopeptide (TPR) repeat protein
MKPAPPSIPDHELLGPIGRGSYGEVWLARNVLGQYRAAKVIFRNRFVDQRPFEREFEGIQRFEPISRSHPSQLSILHVGKNDASSCFYYVMELADDARAENGQSGENSENAAHQKERRSAPCDPHSYIPRTLRHELEKHGRLPVSECVQIGLLLTTALAHLHANGLVHRDIKPSNVIFVRGVPKLGDIGLVTEAGDTKSIVGTEGYMPPEGPGTPQADIFSLGKVLYEISTGMDRRRFFELPEDLRSSPDRNDIFEVNEIVLKACEKDPAKRYRSAQEMQSDLELLSSGRSLRRQRVWSERWKLAKHFLLAALGVGVCMAGIIWWQSNGVTRSLSPNKEAESLYKDAEYDLRSESLDMLEVAYAKLTNAIALDPKFEAAYLKLLDVYFVFVGDKLPPYYNEDANLRNLAQKLHDLNPRSAAFYTVDSLIKFKELKFEEAINEVELATRSDPKLVRAHGLYGFYVLMVHGDVATARSEERIAENLDRYDVPARSILGDAFYKERDFTNAIKEFEALVKFEPRSTYPRYRLALVYEACGQYGKAIDEWEQFALNNGGDVQAIKLHFERQRADLQISTNRWWEGRLEEAKKDTHPDLYPIASLYARLGREDEAMALLSHARDGVCCLLVDDCWDSMRSRADFQELVKKLELRDMSESRVRTHVQPMR